jgi:hypothetical protein
VGCHTPASSVAAAYAASLLIHLDPAVLSPNFAIRRHPSQGAPASLSRHSHWWVPFLSFRHFHFLLPEQAVWLQIDDVIYPVAKYLRYRANHTELLVLLSPTNIHVRRDLNRSPFL